PGSLSDIVTVDVPFYSCIINKTVIDLSILNHKILIVAIERNGEVLIPRGSTTIAAYDKISLMADDESLENFAEILWKKQPVKIDNKMLERRTDAHPDSIPQQDRFRAIQ
ncbi:MAG TPA: TrkA C-terminal domain-containing protein, partial [Bacteriovoracaceae bacterium]|nr:TrkA C-terminal domain-containing protein [Bacteriovoracaceae bacterium]